MNAYAWRRIKSPVSIAVLVVLVLCFFLRYSPDSATVTHETRTRMPSYKSNSERRKLMNVLRAATTPSRTVIMTMVDKSWASHGSVMDLFLESFQNGDGTRFYLNHLVIVALDSQAFQYCETIHPHCYHSKPFTSLNYLTLSKRRNELLLQVLELGYSVVYTDADVMWLRNPFPRFQVFKELTIGCDNTSGDGSIENTSGGFFHLKSNDITIEFFKLWKLLGVLHPHVANMSLCEVSRDTQLVAGVGFRIEYMEPENYGQFCQPSRNISKAYTMHANCCNDLESKVHDLKIVLRVLRNPERNFSEDGTLDLLLSSRKSLKCLTR